MKNGPVAGDGEIDGVEQVEHATNEKKSNKQKKGSSEKRSKRQRTEITKSRGAVSARFSSAGYRPKYRDLGEVPARGPARIYPMYPEDFQGIAQDSARVFFRPKNALMHSVRVKPSLTEIHGMVYAVPAAPQQWIQIMNVFSATDESKMHVDVFIEDLKQTDYLKRYRPYGTVAYVWKSSDLSRPRQEPFMGSNPLALVLFFYLACSNIDEVPA